LLREDRNFHSIQMIEGAYRQYSLLDSDGNNDGNGNNAARVNILLAASRYLAAHSPTMRSQDRTYQIANQLHHGEQLFEEKTTQFSRVFLSRVFFIPSVGGEAKTMSLDNDFNYEHDLG
jgi:hypothetical protein